VFFNFFRILDDGQSPKNLVILSETLGSVEGAEILDSLSDCKIYWRKCAEWAQEKRQKAAVMGERTDLVALVCTVRCSPHCCPYDLVIDRSAGDGPDRGHSAGVSRFLPQTER
jgi:hypothetical protein